MFCTRVSAPGGRASSRRDATRGADAGIIRGDTAAHESGRRKRRRGACRLGPAPRLASRACGVVHQPQYVKASA